MKHLIDQSSKPWKMGTSYRWNCRKWRSNFCTRNSRIINFVNWTKMLHVQHFYFCTLHCAKDYLCNYIPTKISITVQKLIHLKKLLSLMQLKNSKATERRVFFLLPGCRQPFCFDQSVTRATLIYLTLSQLPFDIPVCLLQSKVHRFNDKFL